MTPCNLVGLTTTLSHNALECSSLNNKFPFICVTFCTLGL